MNLRRHTYLLLLLFSLILPVIQGFGQRHYSRNYTINDGLPSNTVHAIYKDSRGILWIGTGGGLCRFENGEFVVFNSNHGLVGDNVFSITEDKNGDLWIGCMAAGISRFDGRKFYNFTTRQGLVSNNVRVVWYSRNHDLIMVSSNDGCSALQNGKFTNLKSNELEPTTRNLVTMGFMEDSKSIFVCVYGTPAILKYDPGSHKYSNVTGFKNFLGLSTSPVFVSNGDTVIGNGRNELFVLGKNSVKRFSGTGQIFGLSVDDLNRVWIAGWADPNDHAAMPSGLFRYDGTRLEPFSDKVGITDRSVWTVYYDTTFKVLWVGTLYQGLFMVPEPSVTIYEASCFKLPALKVNDLMFDKQQSLWIAAETDVVKMDPGGGYQIMDRKRKKGLVSSTISKTIPEYLQFYLDSLGSCEKYDQLIRDGKYRFENPYRSINSEYGGTKVLPPYSLYDPEQYGMQAQRFIETYTGSEFPCTCLGMDHSGNVIVSNKNILFWFDPTRGMSPVRAEFVYPKTGVFALDRNDTIVIGDIWHKGVFIAGLNPRLAFPVKPYYGWFEEKGPPHVIVMASQDDEIWCGSKSEGLFRIANGKVDAFSLKDTRIPRMINAICFDRRGNVIAGGANGTVVIGRTEGRDMKIIRSLHEKDGLVGTTITWLLVDSLNRLYIGTNKGLNLVDLDRLYRQGIVHVRFFNQDEGYDDYSGRTAEMDSRQNVWIGAANGLIRCDAGLFSRKTPTAELRISGLDINNRPFRFPDESGSDRWTKSPVQHWEFNHDENSMTFYFTRAGYSAVDHSRFRYQLDGLNQEWSQFSRDGKAVFTNLDPGRYHLLVESYDLSDNLAISRTACSFMIKAPWYTTWWFVLMVLVLVITSGTILYRWRIRRATKREQDRTRLLIEMSKLELKALQAQMKPHFIFNAINSMQSYILNNDIDKALYYLNMFSKLIRKTLENASKEFIPMVEELDYLKYYIEIEKMRFDDIFDYEFRIREDLPLEMILIPPMMVQLFVENAIKHGLTHLDQGGLLTIELVSAEAGKYCIVVQDNGVGMQRAARLENSGNAHKSFGLQIIRERIRILNETHGQDAFQINITERSKPDGSPGGVRVEFWFPEVKG